MVTIAHALQPLGYRRYQLGHMHWTDPTVDTGYEPWTDKEMWRQTMPREVLDRYDWEAQGVTRRTTGGPSTRNGEQYWGYHVARNAVRLIESAVAHDEPFLCWAAFTEPHPPFYPPPDLYRQIDQRQIALPAQAPADAPPPHPDVVRKRLEWAHLTEVEIRQIIAGYYGMVALVDGYCGTVLDALDRLGIRDETIVVWTVDHGDQMWEHELFLKFVMYEASVHVPLVIDVPRIAPRVRHELVEHVDLFPTLCELVGAPVPPSVQGRSLTPLLGSAEAPAEWRSAVYSQIGDVEMIRTDTHKLNVYGGVPGEFYDLRQDPHEFCNQIADPRQEGVMASLRAQLDAWRQAHTPDEAHDRQS
jgi:arylsulfatase A-like enzyme